MQNINDMRSFLANGKARLNAKAELGKLGIQLSEPRDVAPNQLPRAEALTRRAELRRAMNALTAHAREKPANMTEEVVEAADYISAEINLISAGLDLEEAADQRYNAGNGSSDTALRDHEGRKIGAILSAKDLRNLGTVASKLDAETHHGLEDGGPMALGEFFRGVANMRTTEGVRNALSEGTDASGGYTVPTVLLPEILTALVPNSSLLSAGASMGVLSQPGDSFKIAGLATIPTAAWRSEHGAVATSEPTFNSLTITPRSLAFQFKISRELLQDSTPGLNQALLTAISQAFAKELDRAGLRGSGTAPEIRGLLNISGVHAVDMALPDGATLSNYAKFINAARLIKQADAPAPKAAIMSPREDETIALFADTTGQPLRRPEALADWSFHTTSQIPTNLTVGASTDCSEIYIGDFSLFTFFMREGVSVQVLKELYAGTGEIGFLCHTRVDVAAMYPKAFAVITGVRD